jgi:hypothetical protein
MPPRPARARDELLLIRTATPKIWSAPARPTRRPRG